MFSLLTVVAVPQARAADKDERAKCQQRMEKMEMQYDQQVRKHGEGSKQAENARARMNAEREQCYNQYHSWYSVRDRQWHNDRDWDRGNNAADRDHDRDRGHDRDRDHDHDHDQNPH